MGKVGFLTVAAAIFALPNSLDVLSETVQNIGYGIVAFFGFILFLFDLIRFFGNPYPLKAKITEVLLSAIVGDYYEQNRCWFNWKLNLYGNQFYGKEVFFDQRSYPVLALLPDRENDDLQPDDNRYFRFSATRMQKRTERISFDELSGRMLDIEGNPILDFSQLKKSYDSTGYSGFKLFTIGDCAINLTVTMDLHEKNECWIQMFSGGIAEPFAELTEELTDDGVETLLTFFAAGQDSPQTGIIDLRRGGVHRWQRKNVIYSFRIQDALRLIKEDRCGVYDCEHVNLGYHFSAGFWVL